MSFPKLGNKQHASDGTALLKPDDERSDRPSQARRQSTVQFGGTAAVTVSPGGVKGESKPPVHIELKRKMSRPGLRMQESPFDGARTVRVALHVHSLTGIDAASSTFSACFTLHVAWEKTEAQPAMPDIRLHNATSSERIDSAVETIAPEDSGEPTTCRCEIFYRATLASPVDLTWYPFDVQYPRLVVRVHEECRLRPLGGRADSLPAAVEAGAMGGGGATWRILTTFVSISYARGAFSSSGSTTPEAGFTLRLQRRRSRLTWLCRLPLPLVAAAATSALWGEEEEASAAVLQPALLLLLVLLGLRIGLSAEPNQNATFLAAASAVDTAHLLGCLGFVALLHLQAKLLPWASMPASARAVAALADCAAWLVAHAVGAAVLMRRTPSIDDAAPSGDAG